MAAQDRHDPDVAAAATAACPSALAGRVRRILPGPGAAVSIVLHGVPLSILLLLGHAASQPSGPAPGAPGIELAVAFGMPNAAPTPDVPPEPLPIPELAPPPEPPADEPAVAEIQPAPPPEPEPELVLIEAEPPPPEPPQIQSEPPKPDPAPKPRPKPPKVAHKAPPKPMQQAALVPAEPVPAPLGSPDAPVGAESVAPPSPEPATGQGTTGAAAGAPAIPADGGPLVLLDPAYREPPTPPAYPPRAILLGQQGQVIVRAAIDPRGTPEEVVVWSSSGFPLLDKAAVDAVKRWRFMPARRGGATVAAWVQVPVNFKLR